MTAYLYRAPAGVPGDLTRPQEAVVEPAYINSAKAPVLFGAPVKVTSGKIEKIEANDLASVFAGILSRLAPSIAGDTSAALGAGVPSLTAIHGLVTRGFVAVTCTIGTPARGGKVYMRRVADTGKAIGDLEATANVTVVGGVITGTGTGTIAATVTADTMPGTWSLILQSTSQTALVTVLDPAGVRRKDAVVGTEYTSADGLTFTITAGGTMTAGDSFAPVVTAQNVPLTGVTWATDGKDASNVAEIRIA